MTIRNKLLAAAAAVAIAAPAAALAQNQGVAKSDEDATARIEIGYLECSLLSKSGNIIKSTESFTCTFDPLADGMPEEVYLANVTNWGIDFSDVSDETMRWAVLSSADKHENGVLEGDYMGVSADVAAGYGVGVNAMIGGFEKSIALQPVSVTTQEGVGVAAGIETMELRFVGDTIQ